MDHDEDGAGCISEQQQQPFRNMAMVNSEPERTSNQQMKIMLEDLQAEFDAFRESSAELERELEKELERVEARARHAESILQAREKSHRETTTGLTRQVGGHKHNRCVVHWLHSCEVAFETIFRYTTRDIGA